MFIAGLFERFRSYRVSVSIDPDLLPHLDSRDKVSVNRIISFNLYKFIYAIGTIQSRRFAPSNRQKFLDKSDLLEKIYSDTTDFRVKIREARAISPEVLTTMSEDFGVGISIMIANALFNIRFSTIQRIYGTDKRPDWSCQTIDNKVIVVESKGATSQNTSDRQLIRGLNQKNQRPGDIKIASITLIKEDEITTNKFMDPPISPDDMNQNLQNLILRAGHYSSVFSFLGNSFLSRYYSKMRKRLINGLPMHEQNIKNSMYYQIRDKFSKLDFEGVTYHGKFSKISNDKYLFLGVDQNLISYEGFIEFNEYSEDIDRVINDNHYILFKDGILIIEIKNINEFSFDVTIENIESYQEHITISDIDAMTPLSLQKYLLYVLEKNEFVVEIPSNDFMDLIAKKIISPIILKLSYSRIKKLIILILKSSFCLIM